MANITVEKYVGPSFLASALINGDDSSFILDENHESQACLDLFYAEIESHFGPNADVVDCEEESHFGQWVDGLGHDLVEYTILIHHDK